MNKATETNVPDSIRPYLNEIAERLWAGRAAVMVGAGFSKNAGKDFPDWNRLGDIFNEKASGVVPEIGEQKYQNVLRLAEEVQAAIGRPALENLIQASIPDLSVEPSYLHIKLLEFPWDDIFTTNYDTLLERASAKVVTRRYEPVVNKEDLPYAEKPRIVKLHGSFPSERPFIITEEDYRRYPQDYAPFVNTVQQALLENTFCLIGFSGDDPNFLQWIGWIRDNLGKDKTQKIYLVGTFDLSPARRKLLAQRGITVVDFSCCDDIGKHDHRNALDRFIKFIEAKRPNAIDWPSDNMTMVPSRDKDRIEAMRDIREEWRDKRLKYPGWLILPYENRNNLWRNTNYWINFLPNPEEPAHGLDIQYVFELIWRLERCLMPVSDNIAEVCVKLLKKYWPFQNQSPAADCLIHLEDEKFQSLPWHEIKQAWLSIALAMLRHYREEGSLDKWRESEKQLRGLWGFLSDEQKEFMNYEGFLFSLFTLDIPAAKERLENWQPNPTQPYWMTKRATALAEMGQPNMKQLIQSSLVESRRKSANAANKPDYVMVSREAYQMLLLHFIDRADSWNIDIPATHEEEQQVKKMVEQECRVGKAIDSSPDDGIEQNTSKRSFEESWDNVCDRKNDGIHSEWRQKLRKIREEKRSVEEKKQNARWEEIKAFRCDPWNELELFNATLKNPPETPVNGIIEKRTFDIGHISRVYRFGSSDEEREDAWAFLRFCEEIGLPHRIGISVWSQETTRASLQRLSQISLFWATATLCRLGDNKGIDKLFSREFVRNIKAEDADRLVQSYLNALQKSQQDIRVGDAFTRSNFGVRLAGLLPEVISRLCCKCSTKMKHQVFELIAQLYASPDRHKYSHVWNLTSRLLRSMSKLEQYQLIPNLLKIQFPGTLDHLTGKDRFENPLLALGIDGNHDYEPAVEIPAGVIEQLLLQGKSDDSGLRSWAIFSLLKLHEFQLLNAEQASQFADVLWHKTDSSNLPDINGIYKSTYLAFPFPQGIDVAGLFRNYIKKSSFPIQQDEQEKRVSLTGGSSPLVHEIIEANRNGEGIWTQEDAVEILQRLLDWWDADKEWLKKEKPEEPWSLYDEFRSRFIRLLQLVSWVVGPKISSGSTDEVKKSLERLLIETRDYGLPVLEAEASCCHIFPERTNDLTSRIYEDLTSGNDSTSRDALRAIAKLLLTCRNGEFQSSEHNPVSMLRDYLTWCPVNLIGFALQILRHLLNKNPTVFSGDLETATLKRLERLLKETDYETETPNVNFEEKLDTRLASVSLAATLWKYYQDKEESTPEVLETWQTVAQDPDEFYEIRNAWEDSIS